MNILRKSRKSRTMLFAALLAAASTAQAGLSLFELTPRQVGIAGIVLAAIIAALRYVTRTPLDDK